MSSWNMALRSLRRRRTRTAFTVSGIVVGVGMILVLLSLAAGTSTTANQFIRALGGADITVVNATTLAGPAEDGGLGGIKAIFGSTYTLNQSLAGKIASMNGVYAATPELSATGYVDGRSVFLYGVDPSTYSKVTGGLNIVSGTTLSSSQGNQIVLGKTLADSLNATVGSVVSVGSNTTSTSSYTVVGIYETGNRFQENSGYVVLSSAQNMTGEKEVVTQILVKANNPNLVNQIASQISSTISGVKAITASTFTQSASQLSNTLTTFFTVIGLVALLAGAFGVINTMMMSITERTREIGTLKAIGARKGQILKIFMSEAFLIGLIGGVLGVGIGAIVSYALPLFTSTVGASNVGGPGVGGLFRGALTPTLTPYNLLVSFSLGALVGLLAGLYPAWRASRMDPVEALRHV